MPVPKDELDKAKNGSTSDKDHVLTFGEKMVGLDFNPGKSPDVDKLKRAYARAIDLMNDLRNETEDSEVKRLASVAITEAQGAQMWAVKAATWVSK